jgi:ketosteroid isomerase-like protein
VVVSLVIFIAFFAGCQCEQEPPVPVDLEAEETAVKATIDQFWQAFEASDIGLMSEVVAHDPDMIIFGSDAAERWVGFEEFKTAMEQQFASVENLETSLHHETFKVHESGEVAWYSGVTDFRGTSMGEEFEIADHRVTAVLEKRNAGWVVVQYHGSMPVTGQLVEY